MSEHAEGNGAAWTKKYKPIQFMKLQAGTTDDAIEGADIIFYIKKLIPAQVRSPGMR